MDAEEMAGIYDEIYRLSLEQGEAAKTGDLEQLLQLLSRRGALLASLPRGEQGLRRIAELDRETEARLLRLKAQLVAELGQIQSGMAALDGYRVPVA